MTNEKDCCNCLKWLTCPDRHRKNKSPAPDCFIDDVVFDDDIVTVISTKNGTCTKIFLTPPEDNRKFTLKDLRKEFEADLVLHETPLHGNLYRYGNHGDSWEQTGTTEGYA